MALSLFDASSGVPVALGPATTAVSVAAGPRGDALAAALRRVLSFNGLGAAVVVSARPPESGLWVVPAPLTGAPSEADRRAAGVAPQDWALYLARTHYRAAILYAPKDLSAARAERADLLAIAKNLADAPAESSSRGVVGYRKRFADRLADDLDLGGALDAVWDGLKLGALSPGSRAGLLRLADPVLGLGLFSL